MEEETKKIIINTSDFEVKGSGRASSRKRNGSKENTTDEIRVRPPVRPRRQTVRNNNTLLKFIRRHQEEKRRRLLDDEFQEAGSSKNHALNTLHDNVEDEGVEKALEYLLQLPEKMKEERIHGGHLSSITTDENVSMVPPFDTNSSMYGNRLPSTSSHLASDLRSSTIPSYSQLPPPYGYGPINHVNNPPLISTIGQYDTLQNQQRTGEEYRGGDNPIIHNNYDNYNDHSIYDNNHGIGDISSTDQEMVRLKYLKQKRIKHRTFRVGKSKNIRNVGVLVSNRTIRKGITTKKQMIKQTPIYEIRKYLVKHGLIKVGTTAPNEVLRKMYETTQLMCGELYNHNTDILLHNFMNDDTVT